MVLQETRRTCLGIGRGRAIEALGERRPVAMFERTRIEQRVGSGRKIRFAQKLYNVHMILKTGITNSHHSNSIEATLKIST